MTIISLEIPKYIKDRFGIGENISYDNLIIKTIGSEYLSPDFKFTSYENMKESHKIKYDELENIDKSKLLNI